MAHFKLGWVLGEQGQLDEAIAACRRAIELKPDHADAHYSLGNFLARTGRLDEAVAAYRKAIALRPDHAESHCNLGIALWKQGKLAPALIEPGAWPRAGLATQGLALSVGRVGARMPPAARGRWPAAITRYRGTLNLPAHRYAPQRVPHVPYTCVWSGRRASGMHQIRLTTQVILWKLVTELTSEPRSTGTGNVVCGSNCTEGSKSLPLRLVLEAAL